jgi:hypothetical protein
MNWDMQTERQVFSLWHSHNPAMQAKAQAVYVILSNTSPRYFLPVGFCTQLYLVGGRTPQRLSW